jgi:ATP-dependent DNA helicase DinG
VLTSATLTTNSSFDYIKGRLGVPDPAELLVPGEFDYAEQTILYVPRDLPPPRSADYFMQALRKIRALLAITKGCAFLLFTSFEHLDRVYEALKQKGEYPVFRQGEMPKGRLLWMFKKTPAAVLCATSSFWQGVDVRGEALRAVIIDKLPFQVPTEPLVAARVERVRQEGKDSFLEFTVPSAIITLRQGLGRLIRSRKDRGILAVLDSRLWTRNYGELFFKSLPNYAVTDNIEAVDNFFSRKVSGLMEKAK